MRRILLILSVALLTAGAVIAADLVLTLVWKEPASAVYAALQQEDAESELERLEAGFPPPAALEAVAGVGEVRRKAEILAGAFEDELRRGRPIGRIEIDAIDADYVVVQGTDAESLKKGPGHYPDTALPGQGRTIGIAGHRTTYLAPFRDIDEIEKGDEVVLEMPYATFTYSVHRTRIVEPDDVQIVDDIGRERLVLTACHPLYSAAQRYAVFGRLEGVSLLTDGTAPWRSPASRSAVGA